jgi:hypothetical protein
MANQRGTFAKRNREMKLKDRAKEKAERRAARKADTGTTKGPQIAWDQAGGVGSLENVAPAPDDSADAPGSDDGTDTDS